MTGWQKEHGNPTQHEMNLRETFLVSWKSLGMKISSRVFLIASYFSPNVVIPTETLYYACLVDGTNLTTKIATLERIGFFDDIEFDSLVKILESVLGISKSDIRGRFNYDGKLTRDESSKMIAIIMVGLGFGQIHAEFYGDNIFRDFESLRAEYELQEAGFPKLFIELENVGLISVREKQNQEETDGVVLHPIISEFGRTFNVRFALLSIFLSIYRELTQDDEFPLMSRTRKLADHIEWVAKIGEEHNMFFAGIFWNRLGTLLRANGKFYESIPVFEKALKSFQEFFGAENSHVMAVTSNLAGSYADLGDLSKATELYGKIKDFEPENERERAAKITNEGHMLIDNGELDQALEKYKTAYEIDKNHFGEIHHEVGNDASNLGNLLRQMKDYEGAIKYLEEALNILEQTDGKNHPYVAIAAQNLALALEDTGIYERAVELFLRAKDIFSQQLGEDHQNLAIVCGNLAHCYSSLERNDAADEMYQQSISILEKDIANNNIYLSPAYQEYGKFLVKINSTQKGLDYLVRVLDLEKSIHGDEFEQVSQRASSILEFITLSNMQLIQFERYKEVEKRSKQLLDLLEQHDFNHTIFYGMILQAYSLSLGLQGQYTKAFNLLEEELKIFRELLPPDHPFIQAVGALIENFERRNSPDE
jgi:tetratricopeptide (TPR) repeat protein